MRRNNKKVDSIEIGGIVIAHLLPWIDVKSASTVRFFNWWW